MLESFDDIYKHIEEEALRYKYLKEIGDHFQVLRDKFDRDGDNENAKIAQYEVDAYNLMIKDGILCAQFTAKDHDNNEILIPDISNFSAEELDYFYERLNQVINPRLKSRYAHILWQSPKKHKKYALIAIEEYLKRISIYIKLHNEEKSDYYRDLIECISASLNLSISTKHNIEKVTSEVINVINSFCSDSHLKHSFTYKIIEIVIKYKKHFKTNDIKLISNICLSSSDSYLEEKDLHGSIRMNKLGEIIDNIVSNSTTNWILRNAESYEALMDLSENSPMVASEWCQRSIEYYQMIGERKKVEKLIIKREKFCKNIEFQEVSTQINLSEHIKKCESIGKNIAKLSTDEILGCIASDSNLLPTLNDMDLHASESAKETPLLSLIPKKVIDDRLHVVEHIETSSEKKKNGIIEGFKFFLRLEKVPLINSIIYHSYRLEKLNTEKVLESIKRNSWIGATITSQRGSNKNYTYSWIDFLKPSIDSYFNFMEKIIEDPDYEVKPIMAIDSMTTKFEGMFRDLAQFNGVITHYDVKDKSGRILTREKDLSILLYEALISDLIKPDDLLFFRFLFIEQSGFTLRHRVAHGLMLTEDYNFGILQLLFVALMRLAKYRIDDNN